MENQETLLKHLENIEKRGLAWKFETSSKYLAFQFL